MMAKPKTTEKLRAALLKQEGYNNKQIGKMLGVNRVTVGEWFNPYSAQNRRAASRKYKAAKAGECVDCGAETKYAGRKYNGKWVSLRCHNCANKKVAALKIGRGPNQDALRRFLALKQEATRAEMIDAIGIKPEGLAPLVNRAMKQGWLVRVRRGVYRLA
jgi:hypothetical protein